METPETPTPTPEDLPEEINADELPDEPGEGDDSGNVVEEGD
jgi:hypothetical protein